MLQLEQLTVSLGNRAWLFNVSFETNGVYALLGRSGSGKSTLLNLIAGFIKPDAGNITWQGQSINHLEPASRPVTTLFQQHNLFSHLNVFKNIGLGIDPGLKLSSTQKTDISRILVDVGLPEYENKLPGALSGGEQQRVALARCLLRNQPILLLDEPFSALDATTRQEMTELLKNLIDSYQLCVIMVTHDEDDAGAMGAQVLRMTNDGVTFDHESSR